MEDVRGRYSVFTATADPPLEEEVETGGGGWSFPDWGEFLSPLKNILSDAGDKIDRVTTSVSDVMSGQFLKDAVDNLFVLWVDEMNRPLYDVFSKVYLFTPRMGSIDFVYGLWSMITMLCIILLIIGIGVLANQIIKGKKDLKSLMKVFIIALVSSALSLTVLNIIQVVMNWGTHTMMEGMLDTQDIDYTALGGEDILKAIAVGLDALTDPEYMQFTLAALLKDQGGIMTLFLYSFIVIFPLYLIAVIKLIVLIIMTVGVGFWITYMSYTGKVEALIGFLNIYIRTLLLGGAITLHWTLFVKAQTDYMNGEGIFAVTGIAPVLAAPISMLLFYILFFFLWLRPVWRAVRDPIALNGGEAVEKAGKLSERASTSLQSIGKRLGSEYMQRKGLNFGEASKKMQQTGQRMQDMSRQSITSKRMLSKATGGVSEAIAGVRYELPQKWSEEQGTVTTLKAKPISFEGTHVKSDPHEVAHRLKSAGFAAAQILQVPKDERKDMQRLLETGFQKKYGDAISYKESTGQLVLSGHQAQAALREMKDEQFTTNQVKQGHIKEGVIVHQDGAITMLAHDEKAKEALQTVKDKLPTYTKANLTKDEAAEAYKRLTTTTEWKLKPWIKTIQLRDDGLWIPESDVGELTPLLQKMRKTDVHQVRVNMPSGSAFLPKMLEDLKQQGRYSDLLDAVEANAKGNYIMVQQEQLPHFYQAYDDYRKDRTPYYKSSNHKVKVIIDGVPVNYGAAPLNGLDMGSFEELQKSALRQHGKS